MKRLTNFQGLCIECIGCIEESNCQQECDAMEKCILKLKEYEDLEAQGLLIMRDRFDFFKSVEATFDKAVTELSSNEFDLFLEHVKELIWNCKR